MKRLFWCLMMVAVLPVSVAFIAFAQGQASKVPDKQTCERMMRFGKEAYLRAKYEDAKAYFKKAIEADPSLQEAWTFYDLSTIMALGKRVEKQINLLATTEVQTPKEEKEGEARGVASPSPTTPTSQPEKKEKEKPKTEFKIMHDEGC